MKLLIVISYCSHLHYYYYYYLINSFPVEMMVIRSNGEVLTHVNANALLGDTDDVEFIPSV